jgi:hypothetical protein
MLGQDSGTRLTGITHVLQLLHHTRLTAAPSPRGDGAGIAEERTGLDEIKRSPGARMTPSFLRRAQRPPAYGPLPDPSHT